MDTFFALHVGVTVKYVQCPLTLRSSILEPIWNDFGPCQGRCSVGGVHDTLPILAHDEAYVPHLHLLFLLFDVSPSDLMGGKRIFVEG